MASDRLNRREFIAGTAVAGAIGLGRVAAAGQGQAGRKQRAGLSTPQAQKIGWRIACQLYTFRDRSFYEALEVISSLGIRYVEPCYFLSLDKSRPDLKTSEAQAAFHSKIDQHGDFGILLHLLQA